MYVLKNEEDILINNRLLCEPFSIDISIGDVIVLKGENGTGKSTVISRLLCDNIQYAVLANQDIDSLIETMTVFENIKMGQENVNREDVKVMLERFNKISIIDRSATELSGGEKRIVCLLRAILAESRVVFLDEPTNDMDYSSVRTLVEIIDEYRKEKAFFIVTHDDRFDNIFSKKYCLNNGRLLLIETKNPQSIQSNQSINNREVSHKSNLEFVKSILTYDYINLLAILILFVVAMIFVFYTNYGNPVVTDKLKENEVIICNTIYAPTEQLISEGFLPLVTISYLNGIEKELDNLEEDINNCINQGYSLGLELSNQENKYLAYPLYLFDTKNSMGVSWFELYLKYLEKTDLEISWDTRNVFRLEQSFADRFNICQNKADKVITLEQKMFDNSIISEFKRCYYIVVFKPGYSFKDFVNEKEITTQLESNYFFKTNQTIKIANEYRTYKRIKRLLKEFCMVAGVFTLVIIFNAYINFRIMKKRIRILRDYGFSNELVFTRLKSKFCDSKVCLSLCVCLILETIACQYYLLNTFTINSFSIAFVFIMICALNNYANIIINKSLLDRLYY